jgi:thiol-disulfide isomerase/thioredoxin
MPDRLLIALGLMAGLALAFALFNWLQRRRATATGRREAAASGDGGGGPRILYFRSDTCTSCAAQSRLFAELDAETRALIEKVDVDRDKERATAYNVMTVPTIIVIDAAGEVEHINYGLVRPRQLKAQLANAKR